MPKTTTITVSESVAERLRAIVRERGNTDETTLVDQAITQQLDIDDAWKEEIQGVLDTPADERQFVPHAEVGEWIRSQRTDNPLPRPTGKPRT